ncbi:MAG: two-component system cell cycle response regulator [Cellvibrionaceae bacterium]|jgi:two-component system cell cycle response regulator
MTLTKAVIIDGSPASASISSGILTAAKVGFDTVRSEEELWPLVIGKQKHYDFILVSRPSISQSIYSFVSRVRALSNCASIPIVLLVSDIHDGVDIRAYYSMGFTQVYGRKQLDLLESYIEELYNRDTFERNWKNKVVVIEDDRSQQMVVKTILEERHCEVLCFFSVEEALAQADNINPDIIVSDFYLEGKMTAFDFIIHVRQPGHPWNYVPILVATGMDDPTRKYELVRSGANDYIVKPIDTLDLTVRVENLIRYKHLLDTVEKQRQQMQFLAMHDQLTGLYNRHFVAEHVQKSISEAQRHNIPYSIIALDIDFFKRINDLHGHDVGDQVLKDVGAFLDQQVRGNDVAARMGGEEFLLLLNHCDLTSAAEKAQSLQDQLEKLCPANLNVTASFGVAELSAKLNSYDKLFKAADLAVYRAKESGRNRVELVPGC